MVHILIRPQWFYPNCLIASYNTTLAATAAFKLSVLPFIGIFAFASDALIIFLVIPFASFPIIIAVFSYEKSYIVLLDSNVVDITL